MRDTHRGHYPGEFLVFFFLIFLRDSLPFASSFSLDYIFLSELHVTDMQNETEVVSPLGQGSFHFRSQTWSRVGHTKNIRMRGFSEKILHIFLCLF